MIFAMSPQAKGRVERMAGTFQDRLVTELRLAGASNIGAANKVLEQFLPRFNRRFQVPPQHPEPAFRPLDPELCLDQVLCFKHRRKVARDNTVRFQLHTLQLLPGPELPSYAGAGVEVLEGLDGRLSVRHEGRIVAAQEAPPVRYFSETATGRSPTAPVLPSGANGLGEHWTATLEPLDSSATDENGDGTITDGVVRADKSKATSARKPTFLQSRIVQVGSVGTKSVIPEFVAQAYRVYYGGRGNDGGHVAVGRCRRDQTVYSEWNGTNWVVEEDVGPGNWGNNTSSMNYFSRYDNVFMDGGAAVQQRLKHEDFYIEGSVGIYHGYCHIHYLE